MLIRAIYIYEKINFVDRVPLIKYYLWWYNYIRIYKDPLQKNFLLLTVYGKTPGYTNIIIPKTVVRAAPAVIRKAREGSLGVRGAQIFNLLPENLRSINTGHVDLFKNHLDIFLESIPDQPTMTGLGRAADSNSLLHQLPLYYRQTI